MKSEFKFESYKIDTLNLSIARSVDLLSFNGHIPSEKWKVKIEARNPQYIKAKAAYISGLNIELKVLEEGEDIKEARPLITIEAGIAGLFRLKNDRFLKENEKNIVLIQFPALLFPYLRSALTGLIANAGLGTFIFPLINLPALMENVMEDIEIQTIE